MALEAAHVHGPERVGEYSENIAPATAPGHHLLEPSSPVDIDSPQATPDSGKNTRRRNKPSLSCQACTNKKTKVRHVSVNF